MSTSSPTNIVIIGGGFSGTMVAINLIHKATEPLHIFIVEKTENITRGVAYSTPDAHHLLNISANNMGAFSENPAHFFEWLSAHESLWRAQDEAFATLPLNPTHYYPRKLYGLYLRKLFEAALEKARSKSIQVTTITNEAVDVEITEDRHAIVILKTYTLPPAKHVVIATGNTPVKSFAYAHGIFLCKERYIQNMWEKRHNGILAERDLSYLPESTKIAIVGTSLTMIDAFLSLRKKNYKGNIIAISRHGKLPLAHSTFEPYPTFLNAPYPTSALTLFRTIRNEAKRAIRAGKNWRAVLQAIRPITNEIWAQLPSNERRYITHRLLSYWNIHRHRAPSEILEFLEKDIATGALTLIPGTIYYIGGRRDGQLMVSYRKRGEDFIEYQAADYVINCSGPETDIAKSNNRFLLKLRDKDIISVGTLRTGIELTQSRRVKGKAPDIFHALGALLVGERLESTAVPDIRIQASETAERILSSNPEDYSRYYNYFI